MVSPEDLEHAAGTLNAGVFALRAKELEPQPGVSLREIEGVLHELYYKRIKLRLRS